MRVRLNRRLTLEAQCRLPDGAGGMRIDWLPLGEVWAEISAGSGREDSGELVPLAAQALRITLRAAPEGSLARPAIGQRFAEGERRYRIHGVAEMPGMGDLYLTCQCSEEIAR